MKRRFLMLSGGAMAVCASMPATSASARDFPSRALSWVVPYPVGGFGDSVCRILAQEMSTSLGQAVVVDNRPGAGGQIAASYVKTQPADGHTLFFGDIGPLAMSAALYPKLSYDTLQDFKPISGLLNSSSLLLVQAHSPYRSFQALLERARASQDGLTYGSYGIGSLPHIWSELMARQTQGNFRHVPYKGAAAALQDLMGGHIDLMLDIAANSMPYVLEGKLRALALVGSTARLEKLPQVPTMAELDYPELNTYGWTGALVRAGTSAPVQHQLRQAVVGALHSETMRRRFEHQGVQPAALDASEFSTWIRSESQRWGDVIRAAGVTLE
jgi:tripartite-type tricarboxylate transporter receptor subunit TctC